ncbi:winged helix-turn-helix domain-containing protein [Nocardia sp. CDC159]|uniref:Winged helix-turn-helix domain-containing protein n=1 Tax=Nocardia pulmonis TaxID=2951408 RepID=A0A9X2IWG2_9NOCA|nr:MULTISPECIES: BTAD domain-containing putative transcriptional regulator [Nocardia]MCM6774907.1 winged helix-turn-helix domain-containing protein [Nocardia pulmonis]MCM6789838.1 winged helix-turn-helix domain-containing protein [Nocardia sp. CDC159]
MPPDHSGFPSAATAAARSAAEPVLVGLLGEIAVRRGGGLVPLPGTRARSLVAALAAHPGRSRSAQSLIEDVWGEQPPRAPMNALHTQVSRLRSVLPDGILEIGPAGYRLALGEDDVDLTRARRLERRARELHAAGDHSECLALVATVRALWRGEPAADLPPGPIADELTALAATRWHALDELELAAREAAGELSGAVAVARRIAAAAPLDEPAHATLMRLLAADGRGNEALEIFAGLRGRLAAELGTDPGPTLVALNTAILRGDSIAPVRAPAPGQRVATAQHAAAPPIPEPAASAIGLRAAPNPLLGRDADLAALEELVRTSRVTTVLGPGGTGKTRVANELGARVSRELPVVLVELASVRADRDSAPAEIEGAISATLGMSEISRDPTALRGGQKIDARRRLRDALSARPMLLILDNCEHLIDGAAAVVADLVGACDRLSVLTTSRAPLAITAEAVYPLPPLAIDAHGSPATELFAARARAVRPSVRLQPDTVARLCRTLDGLPLAIELAAARARTMSVEDIESRLEHRFALLRSGDRTSPERHRTMHAVIEWSWNLLDEPQQIALRRLCRFPAGFTLAAAEVVAGGVDVVDVAGAVEGLVSQSLLSVIEDEDGGTRYRMLETVREFGEEQLVAAGESGAVMHRMTDWARRFVIEVGELHHAGEQVRAVLALGEEQDNLTAVLRYALEHRDAATVYIVFPVLGMLWIVRGAHMDLMSWGCRVLRIPPPPTAPDRFTADLQVFAHMLIAAQTTVADFDLREIAVLRFRARRVLRSGVPLSPMARFIGEVLCVRPSPIALWRTLTAGARSRDREVRWSALLSRANMAENSSDITGSMRDSLRALDECDPADVWGRAMLTQHLGQLAAQTARYRESVGYYRQAVAGLQLLRAYDESVELRSFLAFSLVGVGEFEQARRELEIAAGLVDGAGGPDDPVARPNHRLAAVRAGWGELALARGEVTVGLRRLRQSLELYGWPQPLSGPGPGDIIRAAAVLDAHVLHDRVEDVPALPRQLVDATLERLAQFMDIPQVGSVAVAIGSYLLSVDRSPDIARELLVLAGKAIAREDTPSMQLRRHLELHGSVANDAAVEQVRRQVARIGRRTVAKRIMTLLNEIADQWDE